MLVEIRTVPWYASLTSRTRRFAVLVCDQCSDVFERPARYADRHTHFCSRKCLDRAHARGGALEDKIKVTMIERYGAPNASSSDVIKEKRRQTWMAKYGVAHPFQSKVVKSKIETSMMMRHGVKSPMQSHVIRRKAREGMLSWTSKLERQFGELLQEKFQDVQVQVWINDRCIDFYVPCIDTYVQFDGAYWHGLDRPIELIAEGRTPRDVQIYKKWQTDREQDAWFKEHGMRLVRITDREFRQMGNAVLEKLQVLK